MTLEMLEYNALILSAPNKKGIPKLPILITVVTLEISWKRKNLMGLLVLNEYQGEFAPRVKKKIC